MDAEGGAMGADGGADNAAGGNVTGGSDAGAMGGMSGGGSSAGGASGGGSGGSAAGCGVGCGAGFTCKDNACVDICSVQATGTAAHCCQDADCGSTSYCAIHTCTAKKAAGAVCAAKNECSSNSCGGRCCTAGVVCDCPQPTAGNLLKNPGFDTNLSGWTLEPGNSGAFSWSSSDSSAGGSTKCTFSGFAYVPTKANSPSRVLSQCVGVSPAKSYNFGAFMSNGDGSGNFLCDLGECDLTFYTGASCGGSAVQGPDGDISVSWHNVAWYDNVVGPYYPPATAVSAKVSCFISQPSSVNACAFSFDQVSLTEAPATY